MEIARALRFPEEVLTRAGRYLTVEGQKLDGVLSRLERERERLSAEATAFTEKRREAEKARLLFEADRHRAKEEESRALDTARRRIQEEVRKAEGELRAVTTELRRDRKVETVKKASTVLREWKEKAKRTEEDPVVRAMMSRTAPVPSGEALHPGQKVYLPLLSREAEVASPSNPGEKEAEVIVGGMRTRVARDQVRIFPADRKPSAEGGRTAARRSEDPAEGVYLQTPGNTLDLRGMYVDDALPEIDAFLDRLSLAQSPHAFLIHGHGTGALKAGVRRHLKNSPYAKRFLPAPRAQGGEGVTIVLLA